jgi:hypothetical protein
MIRRTILALAVALVTALMIAVAPAAIAQVPQMGGGAGMPDPRQMSGIPLRVATEPQGTVTVRVIRGSLSNAVVNQKVELQAAGGTALEAVTNTSGRAEFKALASGTRVKAVAIVDGEHLESQEFAVPAAGGVRLMLVATDPDAAKRDAEDRQLAQGPAQPGSVVLSDQSRIVIEFGNDAMTVFNILQILNTARTPVQTSGPITFDLPEGAEGAGLLEGSSPQAAIEGRQMKVTGPFAPGATLVQYAYSIELSRERITIAQPIPVNLMQVSVLAQKLGDLTLTSPQLTARREMAAQGHTYIVAQGPGLRAGDVLSLTFAGLPSRPVWPRNLALALAVLLLGAGAWGSVRGVRGAASEEVRRHRIEAQRDKLFAELTALEEQHRDGRVDADFYGTRRRELIGALERVYAQLDGHIAA